MKVNDMEPIPHERITEFVGGWSPTYLHSMGEGWGMSTPDAIRCLYDVARTEIFVQGIRQSVEQLKTKFPDQDLVVIEAGCGTGILAVACALAGVGKVYGLEINPTTARYTTRFIEELGLSGVVEVQEADATQFQPNSSVNLVVSENMHTGLFLEPQIQIISNLRQYLVDGGLVVPEAVTLSFGLVEGAPWEEIGKPHVELRNARNGSSAMRFGNWTTLPKIDFMTAEQSIVVYGVLPALSGARPNGLVVEMDVHVQPGLTLFSGKAEFLGQPHLVHVEPSGSGTHGFVSYHPGGSPPSQVFFFDDKRGEETYG